MIRICAPWWRRSVAGRFSEVLEFEPRTGRWLGVAAAVLLLLIGVALWRAALAAELKLSLGLAAIALLGRTLHQHRSGGSAHIARARLSPGGAWRLDLDAHRSTDAYLARCWGERYGPLIGLEWNCDDGHVRQMWLRRGDVPAQIWRRLRVRLMLT